MDIINQVRGKIEAATTTSRLLTNSPEALMELFQQDQNRFEGYITGLYEGGMLTALERGELFDYLMEKTRLKINE